MAMSSHGGRGEGSSHTRRRRKTFIANLRPCRAVLYVVFTRYFPCSGLCNVSYIVSVNSLSGRRRRVVGHPDAFASYPTRCAGRGRVPLDQRCARRTMWKGVHFKHTFGVCATQPMNRQHILNEIRRTAAANGGVPLGAARFSQETGIRVTDWDGKFWLRWGDALREAGFEPNQFNIAYDAATLIEKFISLMRELRRFPLQRDLKMKAHTDKQFPSPNVFRRRWSKEQLAKQIQDYCETREGYEDVIALCAPITTPPQGAGDKGEIEPEEVIGVVYLMKSGRHYKIGRSNAAGRREYELAIQLPEKLVTLHTIHTDDPAGIEDYWHRRFAAKRKNGEWFDLSSLDIKAFKRRKFM